MVTYYKIIDGKIPGDTRTKPLPAGCLHQVSTQWIGAIITAIESRLGLGHADKITESRRLWATLAQLDAPVLQDVKTFPGRPSHEVKRVKIRAVSLHKTESNGGTTKSTYSVRDLVQEPIPVLINLIPLSLNQTWGYLEEYHKIYNKEIPHSLTQGCKVTKQVIREFESLFRVESGIDIIPKITFLNLKLEFIEEPTLPMVASPVVWRLRGNFGPQSWLNRGNRWNSRVRPSGEYPGIPDIDGI